MKVPFHPLIFLQLLLLLGGFVAAFPDTNILPSILSRQKRPTLFTPQTDCKKWLRENDRAILYPYGRNGAANGAEALSKCIQSDAAAAHRHKFSDIFIVFPNIGSVEDDQQQHLERIVDALPGPLTVRFPSDRRSWPQKERFEMWRSAKNPRKLQGCPYYYQDFGLPAWKDWRRRPLAPPTFIECGAATVKTHVDYNGYGNRPLTDLYRHMKTCADVQALSLSILARGCVIDWEAPFSFDFQRRDIFPSTLENLTISGYHWDDKAYGSLNQAEAWHNAMNWFSLKRLDIDRPPQSFLDTLSGRLPNLESLTIRPHSSPSGTEHTFCSFDERAKSMRQNYTSFITSMPPLQELHLSGMGEHLDLEPILAVHGSSLRNLTIHELEGDCAYETGNATWTRPHLGVGAIKTINRMAPKLRALTVDLYRNAMYLPHSEIDAIAKLPNLEELTLHFDLENPRRKYISRTCMILGPNRHKERKLYCAKHELLEPRITPADPWDIVDRLRRPDGKSVEKLTVVVGNYHRFEGSIGLPVHFYMDPNQPYMYECRAGDVSCETFGGWNDTEKNKYAKAPPAYIEEWDLWGGEEIRDEL